MYRTVAIFFDLVTALFFAVVALLSAPFIFVRGADRFFGYIFLLLPKGLLSTGIRAAIDWQMGNLDRCVSQLEGILGYFEPEDNQLIADPLKRRFLEDLFSAIARAYMRSGHVDDAMMVLIRAHNVLGIRRLRGLGELDARTAHIIRASIATGKLLDDHSSANLTIRSQKPKNRPKARPFGATKNPVPESPNNKETPEGLNQGKVIPFDFTRRDKPET